MVCTRVKSRVVGRTSGDAGALPVCGVMAPTHTVVQVRCSG